jgi:protein-L-isoaspartate(D-aspartate) O-methyltransferase
MESREILLLALLLVLLVASFFLFLRPAPEVNLAGNWTEEPRYTQARMSMVETQLAARDITDEKVLEAMKRVPRHEFVPGNQRSFAYGDRPLPIGEGQTISQPYVVAYMSQALDVQEGDRVLEIGTGSGYQAAVLAELTDEVYTIEIIPVLAERANETLHSLWYDEVQVKNADGYFGWEEHAPFDKIVITSAANHVPQPLIEQLKPGGRMIMPLGSPLYYQTLTLIQKKENEELETTYLIPVRFVPMTGEAQKQG